MPVNIDPSKPTKEEAQAHNMKVAKANFACDLARNICGHTLGLFPEIKGEGPDQDAVARFCIGVSEGIIERFSLMEDSKGVKGGLV